MLRSATAPSPHDVLHWHVAGGKGGPQWAVRQGDWKLIANVQATLGGDLSAEDQKLFLSNLATDVSERNNLAPQHPEVVQRLLKLHEDWLAAERKPAAARRPGQSRQREVSAADTGGS